MKREMLTEESSSTARYEGALLGQINPWLLDMKCSRVHGRCRKGGGGSWRAGRGRDGVPQAAYRRGFSLPRVQC